MALRKVVLPVVAVAVAALVLWLLGVSPAAFVPRTPASWAIVSGVVLGLVLWSRFAVPRLTARPALRTVLRIVPVLALVALVVVPAAVERRTSETLLEGIPTAGPPRMSAAADAPLATSAPAPPSAPAQPERLTSGAVRGVGHVAEGEAAVWRAGDTAFVRLDLVDVQGAVDVVVWLVPAADQTTPDGGVELGALKGTQGTANYVVPDGVDVGRYATVLLWCRAFSTPIAVAVQA